MAKKNNNDVIKMKVAEVRWHPIDWDKIESIEDIKNILKHMSLGCYNNADAFDELKKYLSEEYVVAN